MTRDRSWHADGVEVANTVPAALSLAGPGEIAVIGGADIFALFLPLAHRIELTEVHADYEGDIVIPEPDREWIETARTEHPADDGRPAFAFVTLERGL